MYVLLCIILLFYHSKRMTAIDALNHEWLKSSSFKVSNQFIADYLTWKVIFELLHILKLLIKIHKNITLNFTLRLQIFFLVILAA